MRRHDQAARSKSAKSRRIAGPARLAIALVLLSRAAFGQSPPPGSTPAEAPEEVTVRGKHQDLGKTTLSATDVREMPGAFGDPFRAIEALPGVTPMLSGLPYFFIRG